MQYLYCVSCGRNTGHKRALGWGTFFAVPFTAGISLLFIPFYPKRCIVCGKKKDKTNHDLPMTQFSPSQTPSNDHEDDRTKKCPACAETIKLEAIKCRFCGEKFDPAEVAKQIADSDKYNAWENRVLCSNAMCTGTIGPDGKCTVCGRLYEGKEKVHEKVTSYKHCKSDLQPQQPKKWYKTWKGLALILFILWVLFQLLQFNR